jgi:hypothetical protein
MMGQVSMSQSAGGYTQAVEAPGMRVGQGDSALDVARGLLPESLLKSAFKTLDGNYAWRRADLSAVMRTLADHQLAIVCGEVWLVEGNLVSCLTPSKSGGWSVIAWDNRDRVPGESWDQFVRHSVEEALDAIQELNAEESVLPDAIEKLYYRVSFVDESGYARLKQKVA